MLLGLLLDYSADLAPPLYQIFFQTSKVFQK